MILSVSIMWNGTLFYLLLTTIGIGRDLDTEHVIYIQNNHDVVRRLVDLPMTTRHTFGPLRYPPCLEDIVTQYI